MRGLLKMDLACRVVFQCRLSNSLHELRIICHFYSPVRSAPHLTEWYGGGDAVDIDQCECAFEGEHLGVLTHPSQGIAFTCL